MAKQMISARFFLRLPLRRCQIKNIIATASSWPQQHPQEAAFAPAISSGFKPNLSSNEEDQSQRRHYHTTPKNEMVLYGTIILVTSIGYVAYKKFHGEPLKPKSATEAQTMYQKLEEDRLRRNKKIGASDLDASKEKM